MELDPAFDALIADLAPAWRRHLRPTRAALSPARYAVRGDGGAREAWERLAARGVIPMDWIDDPQRVFSATKAQSARLEAEAPARIQRNQKRASAHLGVPCPVAAMHAAFFAADVPGVLTAEACARDVVARYWPWHPTVNPPPTVIAWSLVTPRTARSLAMSQPFNAALRAAVARDNGAEHRERRAQLSAWSASEHAGAAAVRAHGIELDVLDPALLSHAFRRAAAAGDTVPALEDYSIEHGYAVIPERLRGRPFASLPDPGEAHLALTATGYVLLAISMHAITLGFADDALATRPPPPAVRAP